jgi:hypothetical protein
MKFLSLILILFSLLFKANNTHLPHQANKDRTKQSILARIHQLPEIKEWFIAAKKSNPKLILDEPDSQSKYCKVEVGISNFDRFRTNYWLYIDPKTFEIYYWDQLDTANSIITLQQWRHWRQNQNFNKLHYYKAGKLMALNNKSRH